MWAVVDDLGGPLLLSNVAEYEAWEGVKEMPGADETVLGAQAPSRTVLWRAIGHGDDFGATCWVDETKGVILFLQCGPEVERDEAVALLRKAKEVTVGDIQLDGAFVVAAACVPATKVKTLPSKLMKQKVGGKPLSLLTMKRTDDHVGNVFPFRAGTFHVTRAEAARCRALWLRAR